ncbi:MAG: hypothetical protein KDJ29_09335, partial [Hyphomicrobiales bacterium]|nr:hypothetical protein [Hyphomicrobiales bacterium]
SVRVKKTRQNGHLDAFGVSMNDQRIQGAPTYYRLSTLKTNGLVHGQSACGGQRRAVRFRLFGY